MLARIITVARVTTATSKRHYPSGPPEIAEAMSSDRDAHHRTRIENRLRKQFDEFIKLTRCFKRCEGESRAEIETKYRRDFERTLPMRIDQEMRRRERRASRQSSFVNTGSKPKS